MVLVCITMDVGTGGLIHNAIHTYFILSNDDIHTTCSAHICVTDFVVTYDSSALPVSRKLFKE